MNGVTAEPAADSGRDRLGLRILSAVVLAALALGAAYLGGYLFVAVSGAVGCVGWLEWRALLGRSNRSAGAFTGLAGLAASLALFALVGPVYAVVAGAVTVLILMVVEGGAFRGRASSAVGIGLIVLVIVATIALRGTDAEGRATIFWLFAVVWASDIGAYAMGRTIGGPKLAPAISPGKTWAGAVGGVAAAAGASVLLGWLLPLAEWVAVAPSTGILVAAGVVGSAIGQVGDLTESAFKRKAGAKDSGQLIPGHGGVLDRIDAYAFVVLALGAAALATGDGVPWSWSL